MESSAKMKTPSFAVTTTTTTTGGGRSELIALNYDGWVRGLMEILADIVDIVVLDYYVGQYLTRGGFSLFLFEGFEKVWIMKMLMVFIDYSSFFI